MPLLLVKSTSDSVVLAWPNAKLKTDWCEDGSNISAMWLSGIGHMKAALNAGPSAVTWIAERFAGRRNPGTCNVPPPIDPNP